MKVSGKPLPVIHIFPERQQEQHHAVQKGVIPCVVS